MQQNWLALLLAVQLAALGQQPNAPAGPASDAHHSAVDQRGDRVMGFSHEKVQHHFRLYADGGAIEAEPVDPGDTTSAAQIRMHLAHITKMFAAGDFEAPMLIHAQTPPGVPVMRKLRDDIEYRLEKTGNGARVRIHTRNREALDAVHEFLRFQIADHKTGDSTDIIRN
jgi:hypothetical protein